MAEKEFKIKDSIEATQQAAEARRKLKELQHKENKEFNLLQEMAQEVEAEHICTGAKNPISVEALRRRMLEIIEDFYKDDPAMRELLLKCFPNFKTLYAWRNKPNWKEAVWGRVKVEGMFTVGKRVAVVEAMFKKAVEKGDHQAAKIWLTLSGDYKETEDKDKKNAAVDIFREINSKIKAKSSED